MKSNDFYSDNSNQSDYSNEKVTKIVFKKLKKSQTDKSGNNEKKLEIKKQKEILKNEIMQEKTKLKLLQNQAKLLKPDQCLKNMLVMIDKNLKEANFLNHLASILEQMNINFIYIEQPIPYMINFMRSINMVFPENDTLKMITSSKDYLQEDLLLYLPSADFFSMINSFKMKKEGICSINIDIELFLRKCVNFLGENLKLIFLIVGLHEFLKNTKLKNQHCLHIKIKKSQNDLIKGDPVKITFYDIEEIMLHMQLHFGLQIYYLENEEELIKFIVNFVKAIAEKPFKKSKINVMDGKLCELMKFNQGQKCNAEVEGSMRVWLQQLQQFKNLSVDIANAIVDSYPSPFHLIQAYKKCSSNFEKENLLENINIRRGAGITSTNRKIGSVLSRKIYLFMNSIDGNEEIK